MAKSAIEILMTARSVAIIGASDDGNKPSGRTQRYLRKYGFTGQVFPINPRRSVVQGEPAYASVVDVPGAVPGAVDVAVIVLPQALVEDAVRDCGRAGIPLAIVFASGYAEIGGDGILAQESLTRTAREAGVRIIGPNGNGAVFAPSRLTAGFMTGLDQDRWDLKDDGIAFVSQSGAMGAFILNMAQTEGLGMGRFISTGNEIDLSLPELIEQLVQEGSTRAVLGYIEGIRDGHAFLRSLGTAAAHDVPVVLMKVGRSEKGAAAAASHTGSLAGADSVYEGIFDRYGVQRAESTQDLIDYGRIFASGRRPGGNRVTIVTLSGGAGALMTDYAEDLGLDVVSWEGEWRDRMASGLPSFASVGNPIDVTGAIAGDPEILAHAATVALAHPDTDAVIVLLGNMEAEEELVCSQLVDLAATSDKPLLVTWVGGSGTAPHFLNARGVPAFPDPLRAMRALAAGVRFAIRPPVDVSGAGSVLGVGGTPADFSDEIAAKQLLAGAGIPVVPEGAAHTPDEAAALAQATGYPVVVKLLSAEVAHKSELGVVRLGLTDGDQVRRAAEDILERAEQAGVRDRRLVVQKMISAEAELILGSTTDPVFGPVTMLGIGGVFTEVMADVQVRPAPVSEQEAARMIEQLQGVDLLRGARGRVPADEKALAAAVAAFSQLSLELRADVESLEINPLLIDGAGQPVAVDALVVPRATPTGAERR